MRRLSSFLLAGTVAAGACSRQPEPATTPAPSTTTRPATPATTPASDSATPTGRGGGGGRAGGGTGGVQPYNRVITNEARTVRGLFNAHRIGDRLYFEIPRRELRKDMMIMTRAVGGIPAGGGFVGGGGNRVVTWERDGSRILLRGRTYNIIADTNAAVARVVAQNTFGPIIASFNVESWGPDSSAVIEVTRLFTTAIPELASFNQVQADRSFIEHVAAFPENVNVTFTQTATQAPPAAGGRGGGGGGGEGAGGGRAMATSQRSVFSMLKLPEQLMRPRLHDRRVGLASVSTIDYSRPDHEASTRRYVRRYRLEKRDPNAEVSEPVKPITFYIDPGTPEWLQRWVKSGVEVWNTAYEGAGFRNAIRAVVAPTNDPDFSLADARHSVIYWRPTTEQNATGGQVADPRTGEILKAEVNMYHNVMNLLRNWYFVQVAPLDPRAQKLPLPDSLMGKLVEYVVAHEIGHAIGFPHNWKASAMYPADSIRSVSFLRRMGGHVSTLMDYSRFNYVVQPEDKVPVDLLIPTVGPYDRFAIMWQNKPIPGARTPDDERPTLDQWARMQDSMPWLRFETDDASADPQVLTEAVGDEDAAKSSRLALKNLQRVMDMLRPVAERPGQDYDLLNELYGTVISQWGRYNSHVAASIGGAESFERYGTGERFRPFPEAKQRESMRYLVENAFTVPAWIIRPDIIRRVEQEGTINRIRSAQSGTLNSLLSTARMNRLIEYEALSPRGTGLYTLPEMLADVRRGVWTELSSGSVVVDVYRRNLQRAYLEAANRLLNPQPAAAAAGAGGGGGGGGGATTAASDVRPAMRGELVELDRMAQVALSRTNDAMTRLHLQDVRIEIARILEGDRNR